MFIQNIYVCVYRFDNTSVYKRTNKSLEINKERIFVRFERRIALFLFVSLSNISLRIGDMTAKNIRQRIIKDKRRDRK